MEKKNQIYLSAFIVYLLVGFAGYINQFVSYWLLFALMALITVYTLLSAFLDDKEIRGSSKVEWLSVCVLLGLELVLTIGLYTSFSTSVVFKYLNYITQVLGLGLVGYSIVRYVISHITLHEIVKDKWSARKTKNNSSQLMEETHKEEVANKVEETITQETALQETETPESVITNEVVSDTENTDLEPGIIEIECKQEITTPYMEEEI